MLLYRRRPEAVFSEHQAVASSLSSVVPSVVPWHFLNFLPLPHGQRSLRPILGAERAAGGGRETGCRAPPLAGVPASAPSSSSPWRAVAASSWAACFCMS